MGKTGVANFDNFLGTPFKPLLSQRFLDIMNGQYPKLMLGGLCFDFRRYFAKWLV